MSSENKPTLGARLAERVLDVAVAASGGNAAARFVVRNGIAYPIGYFASRKAGDEERFGDPKKAEELKDLGRKAQETIDDLK